jgi:hypothetical protein
MSTETTNHTPLIDRSHPSGMGGVQKVYRFANGYGASVVQSSFSYGGDRGLWELGVVKFSGDRFRLNYETPITNDVLGHLTWPEVEALLSRIAELPEPA